MDLAGFVPLAAGVLGLVGLLAAAATVARSAHIRATLEGLRGDVADLTARCARLEADRDQYRARCDHQDAEVKVLTGLVTGRADIDRLASEVAGLTGEIRKLPTAEVWAWLRAQPTSAPPGGSPPGTG